MNNKIRANAKISYAYSLGATQINNFCETNTIDVEIRYVDLKIKKSANNYFYKPGDLLHYSIVISNIGNYLAEDVIVVDDLKNLTYVEGSCSVLISHNVSQVLTPNLDTDNITFEIGHIEPQTSVVINYSAVANPDIRNNEDLTNTATIYSKRINPIYSNIISIEQKYANIVSRKTASKEYVYNYDYLDFTISLTNTGNASAYNVQIIETLPQGFVLLDKEEAITIGDQPYLGYEFDPKTNLIKLTLEEIKAEDNEVIITIKGRIILTK